MTDLKPETVDAELLMAPNSSAFSLLNHTGFGLLNLEDGPPAEGPAVDGPHQRLDDFERAVLAGAAPLVDQPTGHLFPPGLYVRWVINPAGSVVTTMLHKTEHPFFVMYGHVRVRDIATGEERDLWGGDTGITMPGTRRVIFAVEDTLFVTVHPNPDNCRDLAVLEDRLIERRELEDGKTAHELFQERLALQEGGNAPRLAP